MDREVVVPGRLRSAIPLLLLQCILFSPCSTFALQSVTLAWNASEDTNAIGYVVYYGVEPQTYTNRIDVGDALSVTVGDLVEGVTYYFAATAYNVLGDESDFSNEIAYTVPGGEPVNQPPTLNPLGNLAINEDAAAQAVNLSGIGSGSPSESQALTVTAASDNVAVVPHPAVSYTSPNSTGTLTFAPAANAYGTARITVTVSDGQALNGTVTRSFTVTVNAVNDRPTLNAIANVNVAEDCGPQSVSLTGISSGAANESQALTVTVSSGNPSLIPTPALSYSSPNSTGTITFTPVTNGYGTAVITVTVNDGQAQSNTFSRTFTVTVSAVNDRPVLAVIGNLTITEDSALRTVSLSGIGSGAANESQTLSLSAVSDNPSVILHPAVNYTSPSTTGSLTFTPVTNANGTANITVTVNDGQAANNTFSRTFTVTVTAVNDAPTLAPLSNLSIGENAGPQSVALSGISSGAANENQTLTVSASSSNTGLIPTPTVQYTSPNATGTLRFAPATNGSGSANITVTVRDGQSQNGSTSRTFTVNVAANYPPVISPIANQVASTNTTVGPLAFTIGDRETAASALTLQASSTAPALIPINRITFGGSDSNRTVTLVPVANMTGVATMTITVSDGTSSASTSFKLTVMAPPSPPGNLMIITNGAGIVTPNLTAQTLSVGSVYTVTAVPAEGNVFSHWSGNVSSTESTISFVMTTNVVLQANFIPSPFIPVAGKYNGLFYEEDAVRLPSSGSFALTVTAKGTYSGRLMIGRSRSSFKGKLDLLCRGTNVVLRKTGPPLTVVLQLGNGQATGSVSESGWIAALLGDRAAFGKTNPAPYAGAYTMIIPGAQDHPGAPEGHGYGTIRVDTVGRVRFVGSLADGTKLSASSVVSSPGAWPLYAALYRGSGSVLSWLTFTNQPGFDLCGGLNWIRSSNVLSAVYPNGFTNQYDAIGSAYLAPVGSNVLDLAVAEIVFGGGNLGDGFTNLVSFGLKNAVVNGSSNALTLTFKTAAGSFKGKVADPATGAQWPFSGVVLQKHNAGYGYLLSTNVSSRMAIR